MEIVHSYPEEAKGFAEDATQEELEVAISSITNAFRNSDDSSMRYRYHDYFGWAEDESRITSDLTRCYEIRKVKSF